jgi:hypothetical protein
MFYLIFKLPEMIQKKYTDLSYFGVLTEANKINASTMLNHIDVWTPNVTTSK